MVELILGAHRHFLIIPSSAFLPDFFLNFGMIVQTFLIDHVLENVLGRFEVIPWPVELFLVDWLLFSIVKSIKIWVSWIIKNVPRHYSTEYRLSGLKVSILERRSAAWGLISGKSLSQLCLVLLGRDFIYFIALSFPMYFISYCVGVPRTEMILWTWSRKS